MMLPKKVKFREGLARLRCFVRGLWSESDGMRLDYGPANRGRARCHDPFD
jgi:hypothetical protein